MLKEVPKAIRPLTLLRTLDIGENQIETIRSKDFDGLHNLYGLRLAGNGIERLQDDVFQSVSTLQVRLLFSSESEIRVQIFHIADQSSANFSMKYLVWLTAKIYIRTKYDNFVGFCYKKGPICGIQFFFTLLQIVLNDFSVVCRHHLNYMKNICSVNYLCICITGIE